MRRAYLYHISPLVRRDFPADPLTSDAKRSARILSIAGHLVPKKIIAIILTISIIKIFTGSSPKDFIANMRNSPIIKKGKWITNSWRVYRNTARYSMGAFKLHLVIKKVRGAFRAPFGNATAGSKPGDRPSRNSRYADR